MSLVFVYGTLKRGCSNHRYLAGQRFLCEARTAPGFRLYSLGDYPGMVRADDDRDGVLGEVWSIDAACLAGLDLLEDTAGGEYIRARVPLLPPFAEQYIEAYLYNRDLTGRPALGPEWRE